MNEKLTENNYLIVPNFISAERASVLADDFSDYATTYDIKNDPQVDKCLGKYDYISFVELLCEKNVQVSQLVGETVLPKGITYSPVSAFISHLSILKLGLFVAPSILSLII